MQRFHVHAKRNAVRRIPNKDRDAFRQDLDALFYAKSRAVARRALSALESSWRTKAPTAVGVIERDLNRLLRFYDREARYWASLRATNPIERVDRGAQSHDEGGRDHRRRDYPVSPLGQVKCLCEVPGEAAAGSRAECNKTQQRGVTMRR